MVLGDKLKAVAGRSCLFAGKRLPVPGVSTVANRGQVRAVVQTPEACCCLDDPATDPLRAELAGVASAQGAAVCDTKPSRRHWVGVLHCHAVWKPRESTALVETIGRRTSTFADFDEVHTRHGEAGPRCLHAGGTRTSDQSDRGQGRHLGPASLSARSDLRKEVLRWKRNVGKGVATPRNCWERGRIPGEWKG